MSMPLVTREGAYPLIDAPLIMLAAGEPTQVDGLASDPVAVVLERKRELWKSFHPNKTFPGRVVFAVAPDVPWSRIVDEVGGAVAAGYAYVGFAFHGPKRPLDLAPSSIDGEIAALRGAADWATRLASLRENVYAACPQAEARGALDPGTPLQDYLAQVVSDGMVACDCRLDADAVMALLAATLHEANPTNGVWIELGTADDALHLRIPAAQPWRDAHRRLIDAAAQRARLWLVAQ